MNIIEQSVTRKELFRPMITICGKNETLIDVDPRSRTNKLTSNKLTNSQRGSYKQINGQNNGELITIMSID